MMRCHTTYGDQEKQSTTTSNQYMIIEQPTPLDDDSPCPIHGKYHNVPMKDVPVHFLDWFLGQTHLMRKYPLVVDYCAVYKRAINKELEEEEDE